MEVSLLDGIVLVVVFVSALLAMYRGLMRELFSIASWAAAAVVAFMFYKQLVPFLKPYISNENAALAVSGGSLFVITLILVSYITMKISDFILDSAFGALDRSAGFLFGAARGVVLLVVAMQFFGFFVPQDHQPVWVANSKSKPYLDMLGDKLVAALPEDVEKWIASKIKRRGGGSDEDTPAEPTGEQRTQATPNYQQAARKELNQLVAGAGRI